MGVPPLWLNSRGQVWIPSEDDELKKCLYAVAHQGVCGLRGLDVTLALLRRCVWWKGMADDLTGYRRGCLQCLKLLEGDMIPRPMGSQLIAEFPGEVLMVDYIKLGLTRTGFQLALMLVDKFARLTEFVPARAATAMVAARAIVKWAAQRGLPYWLISDGGSHFANTLLESLAEILGLEHHITLPYCPWANGSVEVVGKDLLWTLRALCSEFNVSIDEWDLVIPVSEYAINHRPRRILGHRSSVEIMTGREPRTAAELAIWSGPNVKESVEARIPADLADKYCEKLAASLERIHEKVRDQDEANRRSHALREAQRDTGVQFCAGDYVIVSASSNQANKRRHSKIMVK